MDVVTLFSGACSIAADCSLRAGGEDWVIISGYFRAPGGSIQAAPHYAPFAASRGDEYARVDVSGVIDPRRFRQDLMSLVQSRKLVHKAPGLLATALGQTRRNHVVCSSLIARAILLQPRSPLALAMLQAAKERYAYGEVTPADIARAMAILGLRPEGATVPIHTVPVWSRSARPTHIFRSCQ